MKSTADTTVVGGARGGGKANPVTADVYTPFGVKKMGDVGLGDTVCTPDGRNARVIGVYPQGEQDIYKITMQDGGFCRATEDHLWKYSIANHNWRKSEKDWKLATTRQLTGMMNAGKRIMLPVTKPVQFTSCAGKDRVLDPYLLGVLLGDGCITGKARVQVTTIDAEIAIYLKGLDDFATKTDIDYIFNNNGAIEKALDHLDLLGTYSHNKFIPKSYLWNYKDERWKLLRGLMDTDGYVSKDGKAYYTSVSKQLAEDVRFLVKSLGGRCTITSAVKGYRKDGVYHECREAYRLYIRMQDNSQLFRLNRKRERGGLNNGGSLLKNKIVSIEYDGREEAQCIQLDSLESLYLTDDFIVTHNTYGNACKMALDMCEIYSESDAIDKGIERRYYRTYSKGGVRYFYKLLIDYPFYRGIVVRRTDPQLIETIKPECDAIYPMFGGNWNQQYKKYIFPSGAEIVFRSCHRTEDLNFFQSGNFQRLWVAELTQFPEDFVDKIEGCVRTSHEEIPARKIYDTNPGGIGHKWVKNKFVKPCGWISGETEYNEEFDVHYVQREPKEEYFKTENGETYHYVPSTVFDNKFILENDPNYVRNLKSKNKVLMLMWLLGDWDVFAGQYFDMWDAEVHVREEEDFYGASGRADLLEKKRHFDWNDWTLYRSFDYGFKAPWVCLFWAYNVRNKDVVLFGEIHETGLTSKQQAKVINETSASDWGLVNDDFIMNLADPKSYWKRQEKDDEFVRPKDYYLEENIILQKANNDRVQGAHQVLEFLRVRDDGTSRMTILDCCVNTIDTIPNLPVDEKHPEDVDTHTEDHCFDAMKYFLTHLKVSDKLDNAKKKNSWRDRIQKKVFDAEGESGSKNLWKAI